MMGNCTSRRAECLRWDSVVLEGFGPFSGPTRLDLAAGANVLVAANESGKSTLAAAVPAILFGLTGGVSPTGFSEARFRAWHQHAAYRGALLLTQGGRRYLIERDFAQRRVRLLTAQGSSWRVLVDESHHAGAHRRGHDYQSAVLELVGMGDRDLMEQTFYLTQPLPGAGELGVAVQALLSGGGGAIDSALKALHDELRLVTRHTAALGVTTRDARDERRLEDVRQELANLEGEMVEQRSRVDALEGLQRGVVDTRAAQETARAQLLAARQLEEAWGRWRSLRETYEAVLAAQRSLARAVSEAQATAAQLDEAEGLLGSYPECAELPGDAERQLDQLARLERDADDLTKRRLAAEEEVAALRERLLAINAELADYPPVIAKQADLLSLYDKLHRAHEMRAAIRGRRKQLEGSRREAAGDLAQAADWSTLSGMPFAEAKRLRREAPDMLRSWAGLQQVEDDLAAIDEQWAAVFGTLEPPDRSESERLAQNLSRLESLRRRQEQWAELQLEWPEEASLQQPEEVLDSLRRLADLSEGSLVGGGSGGGWRLAAGAALAISGGLVGWLVWLLAGQPWSVGGAAALALVGSAVGSLIWAAISRAERRRHDEVIAKTGRELGLPPGWLSREAGELLVAESRLAEFVARRRVLDPDGMQEEMSGLAAHLPGELASITDPAAAIASLRDLGWRREQAQRSQTLLAAKLDLNDRGEATADPWPAMATLVTLAGEPAADQAALVEWLGSLDDAQWSDLESAAAAWESRAKRVEELDRRHDEEIRGEEARGAGSEASWLAEVDCLRAKIAPFDEATCREHLAARVEAWHEAKRKADVLANAIQTAERGLAEVISRHEAVTRQAKQLREGVLHGLLAVTGGDLEEARKRWLEFRAAAAAVGRFEDRLTTILKTHGAGSVCQLELRQIDQQNRALAASRDWDRLIEDFSALPPRDAVEDTERVDRVGKAIRDGREQAEACLTAAMDATAVAARELARVEGAGPPLNLVQAAQRTQELRREEAVLTEAAEALALAHRELAAASWEYQEAYRDELAVSASVHFATLSSGRRREVQLDQDFVVSVQLPPAADRRTSTIRPESLSQGAQDQLFVALRLAIADLLAGRVTLPLVFDDPFLTFDSERLEAMQVTWEALARQRQVWLLTHRPEFATWGHAAVVRHLERWPDWEAESDGA